jgi:SAM-dependent methyltransferase
MHQHIHKQAAKAERDTGITSRDAAYKALGVLGLDDLGEFLLSLPNPDYPKLSALLPAMASDEVQRRWTGACGLELLRQTCAFVRALSQQYARLTSRSLDGARILDFGCGYGRIARLMYAFTKEADFHAVDPWDRSIELCRQQGLVTNFSQSEYLPARLPVGERKFDLIYAFSVFTHLSRRTFLHTLTVLRSYLDAGGVLAITIRPVEFWLADARCAREGDARLYMGQHESAGFAFRPEQGRAPVDGDVTYGDTTVSVDWIRAQMPGLRVAAVDRSSTDALQRYVFLTRA